METPQTCPNPSGAAGSMFMAAVSALVQLQCEFGNPNIYPKDGESGPEYDFIIVGAGSAGSVVANRLSAIKKWKILLLEAGGDPPYTSDVPGLYFTLQNTEIDWKYRTDGRGDYCSGMINHQCSWARGKVLGGSSTINGFAYFRGNPEDYSRWVDEGNHGWDYKHLVKFFGKSEGLEEDSYGRGHLVLEKIDGGESTGELPLLSSLLQAARGVGNRATLGTKTLTYPGYYNSLGTMANGRRYSTAKAYLSPVRNRENLVVVKNALVTKLLINNEKEAIGVEYEKDGVTNRVVARKEVIVSAGAINSPQLLMLSGIGPREHLQKMGIDVVLNLPVGHNLQDHLLFPGVVASVNRSVAEPPESQNALLSMVVEYLANGNGPLSGVGYTKFTGFVHTTNMSDNMYPDNQIQFSYIPHGDVDTLNASTSAIGYNDRVYSSYLSLINEADLLIIAPSIVHPQSRGRLRLKSKDPHEHPQITANYFKEPYDEIAMLGGIKEAMGLLRRLQERGDVRIEPRVLLKDCLSRKRNAKTKTGRDDIDDTHLLTDEYWFCAMRDISTTDFHPVGTCKMGPSREDSVVDPRLRVHGVKRLRVIDASIMPTLTTGNINGPVVMIAEKGASMVIDEWF